MTAPTLWRDLRRFTSARVGLGRVGHALPTAAHLDFQEAHAQARDAVWSALDTASLAAALPGAQIVASAAPDRRSYLLRPDLGRRLAEGTQLAPRPGCFAIVIADGLCASGVQAQAAPLLAALIPGLERAGWDVAPPVIATQARVAIGDDIGQALGAAMVAVLIGERPGLSSLDSMGIYLTHAPRTGRNDAERNCISNIRPGGISPADAAAKLLWLVAAARRLGLTGVGLKDEQPAVLEGETPTLLK
ncbi:ethanolamine ammonia-lyase subunit EutC [Falsiroseomonas stagni]|uniref:Ethanolamine ammonia-lyase small subunit n=1 Tax=Falsiroseomonas stagni DSM 19981 TaxID=1123062 RepID=A0A1I4CVQ5_9PROT|nr:ethanolamine ammonia-lyase subunit EutC [Falsiroseomonas stagni]SFK83991.1 Ethanolamine ammonia-lyase light chain [Falsiroseomonas stagni DSM 19981]